MNNKERYLGDGVYAEFDGAIIRLKTKRDSGTQWVVAMELDVFSSLLRFAADVGILKSGQTGASL